MPSFSAKLRPMKLAQAQALRAKKMANTRALRISISTLLLLSWSCSLLALAFSILLLLLRHTNVEDVAIVGVSLGSIGTITLLPLMIYSFVKTTRSKATERGTPFMRWQGCLGWLVSAGMIATSAYFLYNGKSHLQYSSLAVSVLCVSLSSLFHLASLLVICKPSKSEEEEGASPSPSPTSEMYEFQDMDSQKSPTLSWQDTVPRLDFSPSPSHSIPRKKVDYFAYLSEIWDTKFEDEETQVGHGNYSTTTTIPPCSIEKDTNNSPTLKNVRWTTQECLAKPPKAKRASVHISSGKKGTFQSLGGASLNIRNSM